MSDRLVAGKFKSNFAILSRAADEDGIVLIPITANNTVEGIRGSCTKCAGVLGTKDCLSPSSYARLSAGWKWGASNPKTNERFSADVVCSKEIKGIFNPQKYDEGDDHPGLLMLTNISVRRRERRSVEQKMVDSTLRAERKKNDPGYYRKPPVRHWVKPSVSLES